MHFGRSPVSVPITAAVAHVMLNDTSVINPISLTDMADSNTGLNFWQRILNDGELASCDALEKLLAGCEIIAAVDDPDLLAA